MESYARQSSSLGTDCVITNAMVTQSSQQSSTLKAPSENFDSPSDRSECIYASIGVSKDRGYDLCWVFAELLKVSMN